MEEYPYWAEDRKWICCGLSYRWNTCHSNPSSGGEGRMFLFGIISVLLSPFMENICLLFFPKEECKSFSLGKILMY